MTIFSGDKYVKDANGNVKAVHEIICIYIDQYAGII